MNKVFFGSWVFVFGLYVDDFVFFDKIVKRLVEVGYDVIEICGI